MQESALAENSSITKRLQKYVSENDATLVDISHGCHVSRVTLGRILAGHWKGTRLTIIRMDRFLQDKGY